MFHLLLETMKIFYQNFSTSSERNYVLLKVFLLKTLLVQSNYGQTQVCNSYINHLLIPLKKSIKENKPEFQLRKTRFHLSVWH